MFEEIMRSNLLILARTFAKAQGVTLSAVSFRFYSLSVFFEELESGKRSCSLRKTQDMIERFARDWPHKTPWPKLKTVPLKRENFL